MHFLVRLSLVAATFFASDLACADNPAATRAEQLPAYHARFGRSRPVVAVVGENSAKDSTTEVVDFVVPYAVLSRSDTADVIAVATQTGPMQMRPALRIEAQATLATFDARYPDGADYVVVPAVAHNDDKALIAWIAAQSAKGATVMAVCDGAIVLGNAGLLKGRRATAHFASLAYRTQTFPGTHWISNTRYVVDGTVMTTSGISAALPASLALVEAIAGRDRATALAAELGVTSWSAQHDSDAFHLPKSSLWPFHKSEDLGIPVAAGVDDIALALTADAYSRTTRSKALSVATSKAPLQTRQGLSLIPDAVVDGANRPDRTLPVLVEKFTATALDVALSGIGASYGNAIADQVAVLLEYPRPVARN